jgi:hypothetical protein
MSRNAKLQRRNKALGVIWGLALLLCTQIVWAAPAGYQVGNGRWVCGDFHQHTTLTDGSHSMPTVMSKENFYGLDWWANSEHGGAFSRDAMARFFDQQNPPPQFLGNPLPLDYFEHKSLWRWQSLLQYSFPLLVAQRHLYLDKLIAQGLEWNVPSHEHCSVGIVAKDALPIAQFEYRFDQKDADTSGGAGVYNLDPQRQKSLVNDHAKAVNAVKWLQQHYPKTSWVVFAHPERQHKYKISDFRDFNNAAPDVAFGFEGLPGHQKAVKRGEYFAGSSVGGGTYGGAGYYIAHVGGLWDALLGEGRHWWTFVSSDFHDTPADFWPGEYAKTWIFVPQKNQPDQITLPDIVNALRSGNSFCVHGDLINGLDFQVKYATASATMGQELKIPKTKKGNRVTLTIKFNSPPINNHGDKPVVDYIDLIMGKVTGKRQPGTPEYQNDTNPSTRVIATFTSGNWEIDQRGWNVISYTMIVNDDVYFRLRGTNVPPNTPGKTDAQGNPVLDPVPNSADFVWSDLWFYSNPIFIRIINKP